MSRPRALYPCEAYAALAALMREPARAAALAPLGVLDALPAGAPRQVAYLLAAIDPDYGAAVGVRDFFEDTADVARALAGVHATYPAACRVRARPRAVQVLALRCCGRVLTMVLDDGRALLAALEQHARAEAETRAAERRACDAWLRGTHVA